MFWSYAFNEPYPSHALKPWRGLGHFMSLILRSDWNVPTQGCPLAGSCITVAVLHLPEHPFNPRHCSQTISNIFRLHSDNDMPLLPHIWSAHFELWDFTSAAHMGSGINEIKIPGKNGSWLIQNQALIKSIILVQLTGGKNLEDRLDFFPKACK